MGESTAALCRFVCAITIILIHRSHIVRPLLLACAIVGTRTCGSWYLYSVSGNLIVFSLSTAECARCFASLSLCFEIKRASISSIDFPTGIHWVGGSIARTTGYQP